MIEFTKVDKAYKNKPTILQDVSFTLATGEWLFIHGATGSGKSTVLKLMAALETPTRGSIQVNGQHLSELSPTAQAYFRRGIGFVGSPLHLVEHQSALENVMLPLLISGESSKSALLRAQAALEKVNALEDRHTEVQVLSRGRRQQIAIARALVNRPKLIIADEPTAYLDSVHAEAMLQVFKQFHRTGVTCVFASSQPHVFQPHCDRRLDLVGGCLHSTTSENLERSHHANLAT